MGKAERRLLAPGVSFVARPEAMAALGPDWVRLVEQPLTILVGVTGVGKSTTLAALQAVGVAYSLLPDRRLIADDVVIGTIQALDGGSPSPVTDRAERFEYTRRYRQLFPGGVAHALTRLVLQPTQWPPPLLFDGLRGQEEVGFALTALPRSRFVVLHAPDEVRVSRLLGRADTFDHVAVTGGSDTLRALRALPGIGGVFSDEQVARLAALAGAGDGETLLKQVAIVVAERRNYDPDAARQHLERHLGSDRLLVIDTARYAPTEVARRLAEWWR